MTEPTEPPQPPELPPTGPPSPTEEQTGEFAEFFHTEDLPVAATGAPRSHRGAVDASPFLAKLMAPATAVVVVIVVIVLLIWINGGSAGNGQSPAAVGPGAGAPPVGHHTTTSRPTPDGTKTHSVRPTVTPTVHSSPPPVVTHHSKPAKPKHTEPVVPTAMAPVTVLNNSRRTGLAHAVAAQVQAKGWPIATIGNLQGLVPVTTVYYPPGEKGAALHLEHDFSSVQRIEPNRSGNIHGANLTLVVTQSWVL